MANFFKSLDAATSNSTGLVFDVSESGVYNIGAYGTWDTATVTFYVSLNEDPGQATNGFTDSNGTFTADGGYNLELHKGSKVWATLSSVGGSTSVTAKISSSPIRE